MQRETKKIMGVLSLMVFVLGIWRYCARRVSFLSAFGMTASTASIFVVRPRDLAGSLFASVWLALTSFAGYAAGRLATRPFRSLWVKQAVAECCLLACLVRECLRFHRLENRDGMIALPVLAVCSLLAAAVWTALAPSRK